MKKKKREKIFIIGHKNPDTDTIVSAIGYAFYLNKKGKRATAVRSGQINPETKFVLDYFGIKIPSLLKNIAGKKVILVDHNEKTQSPEGVEKSEILEVIDHHKIDFQYPNPIFFLTEPIGSTSTIIAKRYLENKIKIPPKIAAILLSGILSDTVVFRSSTTTKEDIKIAQKLAKRAKIKEIEKFGIEIKKKKASLKGMKARDIIYSDFKTYNFSGKKIGVGQIEIFDQEEVKKRKKELLLKLKEIARKEKYDLIILMITDIIKRGSEVLAFGETDYLEKAFGKKIKNNSLYLAGVISRKKEIIPPLMKVFNYVK